MMGGKLTRAQAMNAKCFECMNGFVDGKADCRIPDCPLYSWRPFKTDSVPAVTPERTILATSDPETTSKPTSV